MCSAQNDQETAGERWRESLDVSRLKGDAGFEGLREHGRATTFEAAVEYALGAGAE